MTPLAPVVFLLDVDNTLLDNDQIIANLKAHLQQAFGAERQQRYWTIFEKLRTEKGYADYLGALQRKELPPGCRAGDNANAFCGGFRLWEEACEPKAKEMFR